MKKTRFFKESKLRKYKNKALDMIEKGKYEKALSIYRDILESFPGDTAIMLKIGDLCQKMNLLSEAVTVYGAAVEYHAQSGRLLQAIAVCRIILEIDGSHRATQKKLASLYARKYGSAELSGLVNAKALMAESVEDENLHLTEYWADPATDQEVVATSAKPLLSLLPEPNLTMADTRERNNNSAKNLSKNVNSDGAEGPHTETLREEVVPEQLDDTEPICLDFTPVFEDDEEPSAIYDQEDLDEYMAELCTAGLTEELQAEQQQMAKGNRPEMARNLVVQISRPAPSPDTLPPIPFFSRLNENALLDLINELPLRHFEAGETIVREGAHGDSFFVVISGSVEVIKDGVSLTVLEEGAFFGETTMLFPGPRLTSVVSVAPCALLEVSNVQLELLRIRHPRVGQVLLEFAEDCLLNNLLNTSPIFAPFNDAERQSLMEKFEPYMIEPGASIIREGAPAAGLFLIVIGEVSATVRGEDGQQVVVETLKGNEIFGEVALLSRAGAIATFTATAQTRVLMLPAASFNELIMTHPQVLELVSAISEKRIANMRALCKRLG